MIDTPRLLISELSLEDLEEVRQLHNEPDTLRWLSNTRPVTSDEQVKWFKELQKTHSSKRFVARAKSNGNLIGVFRFDHLDNENSSAVVGLDVSTDFRRLGFAREIYNALIPYFFTIMSLNRLSLITLETNAAAIKLYESLGFKREGLLREAIRRGADFENAIQFGLLRADYEN